ncbi:SpoIIE family protein phosphatase [Actinomadura graeca]|uniref:SpoIIE family protein phosphatase n=1 Tax=Actinomadura graeca TaxID=2750812 RepID=A0ABX8QZH3_9ACTN|nr:ATP-binding SpoIIE family protein phosphatase [Actinomadura graeca]QXJ23122.1 SpoIIE family protein phosphatase [Actinomadura graeca]
MAPLTGAGWSVSPSAEETLWLRVEELSAVAGVRRRVTALAGRLGFSEDRLAQIALAVSEAASNLHKHAVNGMIGVWVARAGGVAAIEFVCVDSGPGIADVPRSMLDGYSTSGTLGLGLGAISRLADSSDLHSIPRRGSVLTARFAVEPGHETAGGHSGLTKPKPGEQVCGDGYAVHTGDGVTHVMLCDGLGHGALAERAAAEAVRAVRQSDLAAGPGAMLAQIHRRLAPTRGGAVAVAEIDFAAGRVRYAGLGNIAGWIVDPERRRGMISVPGIAGHQARTIREHAYDLPPDATVVLHSDGLNQRWSPVDYPGLFTRRPMLVTATLLRDAGVRNDDASIVAVRAG